MNNTPFIPIKFHVGETVDIGLSVIGTDGNAIDLSSVDLKGQILNHDSIYPLGVFTFSADPVETNVMRAVISATNTNKMTPTEHASYAIQMTDSGVVSAILSGSVKIKSRQITAGY